MFYQITFLKCESHLLVAEVSLVEGDTGQLVALTDVEHRNRVSPIHQLLHQVSAQETGPPDDCTPFVALYDKRGKQLYSQTGLLVKHNHITRG